MTSRHLAIPLAAAAALALSGPAPGVSAQEPKALRKHSFPVSLAPLSTPGSAVSTHAPFEAGDCSICHVSADRRRPGPVSTSGNALCTSCHEEFQEILRRPHQHPPAVENCLHCHNPHDSRERKLLHVELAAGCNDCHRPVKELVERSRVKHGALEKGAKCASCHNPHGSSVEKLLIQLPFDLCVTCHAQDDVRDDKGAPLTNFKKLLDQNKVWHAPVQARDCSACHLPHGGDNFRLLVAGYPAAFYSAFDPASYALCFGCHNEKVVSEPETRTLTNFRDGARNLHFVHVNKADRGRTCRACHEVHASRQPHHVRDGVPYGSKGWVLQINYTRTATGGQCAKTCHDLKSYTRD